MQIRFSMLALLAALAAGPLWAQEATTETPATDTEAPAGGDGAIDGNEPGPIGLSMGEEDGTEGVPKVGQTYIASREGDFEIRCVKEEEGKTDPCQLYQLLRDSNDNAVAEFSIFNIAGGGQAVAGATIITPLETLLTERISLNVDGGSTKRYPFTFCAAIGCFARVGFTNDDLAAFRAGNQANVTIVPAGAPDQKVALTLSLTGFTAGYAAMVERNTAE